jgi:hypothetical protein
MEKGRALRALKTNLTRMFKTLEYCGVVTRQMLPSLCLLLLLCVHSLVKYVSFNFEVLTVVTENVLLLRCDPI